MAVAFVFMMCPAGIAVALLRRCARAVPAGPAAVRDDMPVRLLRWAAGLLSAQRAEWGQAMLGELDHIDGRTASPPGQRHGSGAEWIRFRRALERRALTKVQPRADDVPASVSHAPTPEPSQAKDP